MTASRADSDEPTEVTPSGFGVTIPQPEPEAPIDASEVEALLRSRQFKRRLPPVLEDAFLSDAAPRRLRTMVISGAIVALAFNFLLVSDWLLIPDQFDLALRLRLLIFTPAVMVGVFLLPRIHSPRIREWLPLVPGGAAALINVWLCITSNDIFGAPYMVSLATIAMFANSVVRMRFAPALALDLLILLVFLAGAFSMPPDNYTILIPGGLLLVCTITFTLYGCYCQERDDRVNWLLHLRERLLLKDLEAANRELEEASRSDMLTDLANRRHFNERSAELWQQAKKDGQDIAIVMMDVDHFKAYNDRYGHLMGDICLKAVAGVLKKRLRGANDFTARYGGEEFIAVLTGTSRAAVFGAAERIRRGVEGLNIVHAGSSTHEVVTVSIGVATVSPTDPEAAIDKLIAAADHALYCAKGRGRNCVVAYEGDV